MLQKAVVVAQTMGTFLGQPLSRETSCFSCQPPPLTLLYGPDLLGANTEGLPLPLCTSSLLAFRSGRDQRETGWSRHYTMLV